MYTYPLTCLALFSRHNNAPMYLVCPPSVGWRLMPHFIVTFFTIGVGRSTTSVNNALLLDHACCCTKKRRLIMVLSVTFTGNKPTLINNIHRCDDQLIDTWNARLHLFLDWIDRLNAIIGTSAQNNCPRVWRNCLGVPENSQQKQCLLYGLLHVLKDGLLQSTVKRRYLLQHF